MDADQKRRVLAMLARIEGIEPHDLAKMIRLAQALHEDQIDALPPIIDRARWMEEFWARAKRAAAAMTLALGALYMFWDAIKAFLRGLVQ